MSQAEVAWQSIARRKQQEQINAIPENWILKNHPAANRNNVLAVPRECGILSAREIEITEKYDATALVQELAVNRLKSVDVVTAFCKRAAIAQQLVSRSVRTAKISADDTSDKLSHRDHVRRSNCQSKRSR